MSSNDLNSQPASCRVTYTVWDRIKNVIWAIAGALAAATVDFHFAEASQWIVDTLCQLFRFALRHSA